MPDGGQERVFESDEDLLLAQAGHEPVIAGAEVDGLPGAGRGHGRGAQGGVEPAVAVASAAGLVLAGGRVVAGAEPGPRGEVACGREAGHVAAGLRDDGFGDVLADAGDGLQQLKLADEGEHLLVDPVGQLTDRDGEVVDAFQVEAAQERVVLAEVPGAGLDQRVDLGAHASLGHRGQGVGVAFAVDESAQHGPARDAHDVGGHAGELDARVLPFLLERLDSPGPLGGEGGAVASEVAQVPDRLGGTNGALSRPHSPSWHSHAASV